MAEILADNSNRVSNLDLLKELQGGKVQTVASAQTPDKIFTKDGESARGRIVNKEDTDDEDSLKSPFKLTRCLGQPITFLPETDNSCNNNEVASDTIYAHVEIASIAENELVAVTSGSKDKPTAVASDPDFKDLNEYYAHPKRLSTMSTFSSFEKTRAFLSHKNEKVTPAAETTKAEPPKEPKDVVGDHLLDSYPDRNPGETCFPHLAQSVSSPDLDGFYKTLRDRIVVAVHEENFRGGHFKLKLASDHGSIQAIILEMQLSGEVSKKQYAILRDFGRVWSAAIGETKNYGVLHHTFLVDTGLAAHSAQLFAMFDEEKRDPNLYPLPAAMKYKDPVTLRKELEEIIAKHKGVKAAAACAKAGVSVNAGLSSTAGSSADNTASSSKDDAFVSPTSTNLATGISKARLLSKLSEFKASESKDTVMRNAWNEICNHKGDITAEAVDGMSDETMKLIYDMVQSDAQALNVQMPMGTALITTLARLEALERNGPPSKAASDLCSASKKETKKESKVSKLKKFSKEKVDKKSKKNA